MAEEEELKEAAGTCYQWRCRVCGANGVFRSYGEAKTEAEDHRSEAGSAHHFDITECD